ncbi:YHS domain protein [Polystyrenella longa]|uniref:YHS domain protein n=1 Tax=Polystyrenella longa TaxID=2528007 RepID=A0A518CQL7_9PLAN|nr:hypothetical protein [Polystyrenella longa]QDU81522.1 YHS domain protein [Polystyrenella longa]
MNRLFVTSGLMAAMAVAVLTVDAYSKEEKQAELPVALEGNCAVCLLDGDAVVKGTEKYTVEYDGQRYLFPDESTQQKFTKNPAKYAPVLNGDCTVCYEHGGHRPAGKVEHHVAYEGRLYLFPSEGVMKKFTDSPEDFVDADLAYDGNCAVCLIDGGAENPGKAEFTAHYKGMRYQFPNAALQKKFEESPAQYAVKDEAEAKTSSTPKSGKTVSIEGRSACAGCEFKVRPTLNPEELGLAVVVSDTEIYIIEKAHESYSKIYDDRFDSVKLAVKGKVLKKEGRYTWIEPENVTVAQ